MDARTASPLPRDHGGCGLAHGRSCRLSGHEPLTQGEKSEFRNDIWVATGDGQRVTRFTRGDMSAMAPAFSPDGRWLGFLARRSGNNQVWVMPVDGGEAFRATNAETDIAAFAWAPDGMSIGFLAADPKTEEEKTAEREKRDVIVLDRTFEYRHIYIAPFEPDAGEQTARRLTRGAFHVVSFDWAPGGGRIVFAHRPHPTDGSRTLHGDLSLVDVESGEVRPLVSGGGVESDSRFSPDGRIAFVSSGERPEPIGLADVYVMSVDGGARRKLAELPDHYTWGNGIVGWNRDGTGLYVGQVVRTESHLFELPLDGGAPRRVTQREGVFLHFALSRDAFHLAFTFETPDTPHDVYLTSTQRIALNRVSDLHRGVPRPRLGRTELLRWLSWRTGIAPGAAREKVRVARALAHLPQLSDAMRRGELSYANVRAATRVATIENELELLMLAQHGTAAHMQRVVRAWRRVDRLEELREESDRYRRRHLTLYVDEDGSYVIHGRLDPETGALLERALEAAGTALLRKGRDVRGNVVEPSPRSGCAGPLARSAESAGAVIAGSRAAVRASGVPASPRYDGLEPDSPLQGRVDALGVVAEYALRSELGAPGSHDDDEAAHGSHDEPQVECDAATMSSNEVPSPGSPDGRGATKRTQPLGRADRFQVIVHVDAQALRESSDTGQSVLDDGIRVSAETSRRLACDASRVVMLHDTGGDVLDVGRRTRTVPSAIRRALVHRDRGCRFPGCGARFCDAHHIVHWADGGRTRLDNLVLLCRRHHRAVHEEGFRLTMTAAGEVCVVLPNGTRLREVPAPPRLADDPVLSIERVHAELGIAIDAWTPTPLWHGERLDLGLAILSLRGGCQAGTDGTGTSGVATAVPEAIPGGR